MDSEAKQSLIDCVSEACTFEQVLQRSAEWCAKRPAWMRICDMSDELCESLYVQWDELRASQKRHWGTEYAYNEFSIRRCKVPHGVISGKGEFYASIADVPLSHNSMSVFKVGKKVASQSHHFA
jgi:hypothetical protein